MRPGVLLLALAACILVYAADRFFRNRARAWGRLRDVFARHAGRHTGGGYEEQEWPADDGQDIADIFGDQAQSETACCPRETIPDSCSCLDGCGCMCLDCGCEAWGDDSYEEDYHSPHRQVIRAVAVQGVYLPLTGPADPEDRKSTRLNSSHQIISYAV